MEVNSVDAYRKSSFKLEVDDNDSGIRASGCTFNLYDSIYSLYPKANFTINDFSGKFNEFMGFVNGTKLKIYFGIDEETWKNCSYRVIKNSMPQQNTQNNTGGSIELSLIHDYFNNQNKKSTAYNSNISDIIKDLASNYSFESIDINNTLNSGIWYQPYITDADFIMNTLLPFSYSTDSDNSPFYCFIDSNNNFNFKNYKRLFLQNNIKTLTYRASGSVESLKNDTILSVNFAQIELSKNKPYYNRIITYYNENGNYIKDGNNALISNFPKNNIDPIPIKANLDLITGVETLLDNDINLEDNKNNRLGYISNQVKECISPDKVIITLNLDRELCAGKKVRLNLPSTDSNTSSDISLRNSGEYLIESSYHKWTGTSAITILVCSKQVIKVTPEYRNVALIINR